MFGTFLKRKKGPSWLSNAKRLWKTTVAIEQILSLVKKNPFTTAGQIKNPLQEAGVFVNVNKQRRLLQREHRVNHKMETTGEPQKQEDQIRVCQTA